MSSKLYAALLPPSVRQRHGGLRSRSVALGACLAASQTKHHTDLFKGSLRRAFLIPRILEFSIRTSVAARAAIKWREDERLTAYTVSVGIWTIGAGHTAAAWLPAVKTGMKITAQ